MSKRPTLPKKLKQEILYNSAFACAICSKKGDHIHHIDKDNSNNNPENLILLCQAHHDEAHTKRELSQNLTPELLKKYNKEWCAKVRETRSLVASASGQESIASEFLSAGITWGYINHSRLIQTATRDLITKVDQGLLARLISTKVVDERGILLKPKGHKSSATYIRNTIYDWYEHQDSMGLHIFYSELVDLLIEQIKPIHLDEKAWNRNFIKEMVSPGTFIFINRAQYFKKGHESAENAEVAVQTFKRKIKIEYQVNTRNMYGSTSITCSFSGHKSCASLLQVKSIEDSGQERILHCTPIALGIGFHTKTYETLNHSKNNVRP